MKKLLYGTTALAAAGLLASNASAADKIKLGVGGYMQMFAVYVDQDTEDTVGVSNHALKEEGEIIFNGKTTLDNGLEFGVQVQLEAETCSDQIDEHYIWVEGGFGRINLGAENSAPVLMHYAPSSPGGVGFEYVNFQFTNGPTVAGLQSVDTYNASFTEDAEKLTYFTPRLAGFQFGVSYAPDRGTGNGEAGSGGSYLASYGGMPSDTGSSTATNAYNKVYELGANYVNKFAGADIAVSAGYHHANVQDLPTGGEPAGSEDRKGWDAGAQLGFAGFTVAAAYAKDNQGTDDSRSGDLTNWDAGVYYGTGPWKVGVAYYKRVAEGAPGTPDAEFKGWEIGGKYTLGPGVTLGAGVMGSKVEDGTADAAGNVDNEATAVYVGTMLSF
ncbi:MAG TPA: porin [Alphaproteobacteria bacterium]|nr:porin [Alphaproteobacteria bacterium]